MFAQLTTEDLETLLQYLLGDVFNIGNHDWLNAFIHFSYSLGSKTHKYNTF